MFDAGDPSARVGPVSRPDGAARVADARSFGPLSTQRAEGAVFDTYRFDLIGPQTKRRATEALFAVGLSVHGGLTVPL